MSKLTDNDSFFRTFRDQLFPASRAWTLDSIEAFVRSYQASRNLTIDGWAGSKTTADARDFLKNSATVAPWRRARASSFADPKDIAAFKACKARGHTDSYCFAYGDNGIGAWGHDTTGDLPMAALPRETWRAAEKTGGDQLLLRYNKGPAFPVVLGDTMPSKANIKNGAGIDLNPAALALFNKQAPILEEGFEWCWPPTPRERFMGFIDSLGLRYFTGAEIDRYWDSTRGDVTNSLPPKNLWNNAVPLLHLLDAIRVQCAHPVKITSSYRSPEYNKAVGGVSNSQHLQFKAADIQCPVIGTPALHRIVKGLRDEGVFKGGIGKYSSFVHVDVRGTNATWNG